MSQFVYDKEYNVKLYGFEKMHPFDTCKFEKIARHLQELGVSSFASAPEVTDEQLLKIHTEEYLERLRNKYEVADLCEMFILKWCPIFFIRNYILKPMRYQVSGTILAGEIAIERGWSINLGGGMHHASSNDAGGWCLYSDIPLSIKNLFDKKKIKKAMIIDLDVHQGNGIETDIQDGFFPADSVYMIDAYNHNIFPAEKHLKKIINIDIKVSKRTTDSTYLKNIKDALSKSKREFKPDIVFYNAGTDILDGDPLNGGVSISFDGVIKRDELVFRSFIKDKIPIVMVLSGGYSSESVNVIKSSLENLYKNVLTNN
jgi:histone deacetylase 11